LHRRAVDGEIARLRRAEEMRHLRRRRGRAIVRHQAGDAPAPGIGRLVACAGRRIGQRIVRRHIHEQKGIEQHPQAPRLQRGDGLHDAGVGRRAAIGGAAIVRRHHADVAAPQPRHRPFGADHLAHRRLHLGRDRAGAAAQIVAEPGNDERHGLGIDAGFLKLVDRHAPVARALRIMHVDRAVRRLAENFAHDPGVADEFARARNDRDGADHFLDFAQCTEHFE